MLSLVMFEKYSKAGTGAYALAVAVVLWVLGQLGFTATEGQVLEIVNAAVTVYGVVMSIWGTYDRKDLKAGVIRKDAE